MFKELHPNIRIRIYTSFLSRVIGSMIFPFMAIYFTNAMNATTAGILLMIQVIIQFVAGLYGGYLADILGRKRMMVTGEWMKVVSFIGILLANSPWWTSAWMTFIMLIVLSVSQGIVNPAAEAMLIDVSTKETRAFMYSVNYWAVNFSIMLGVMVGGWLFKTHFFELLIVLFIISVVTLWMTAVLIEESYQPGGNNKNNKAYGLKPVIESYRTVITDWPFVLFTLGGIAILSLEFQRNNFISVRLEQEFPLYMFRTIIIDGVKMLSLLTLINTLIIVLFTVIASKWIRGKAEQPIMYGGFLLFGLGYAVLASSNQIGVLLIAVIVLSIGELLYVPTRQAILAGIVDDTRRGAYMAFNGLVFQVGKMFGAAGIIVGELIDGMGMAILYVLFALLGILFSWKGIRKSLSSDKFSNQVQVASKN